MDPCLSSETLAAYQEGVLPVSETEALEKHTADCRACRNRLLLLGVARRRAQPAFPWLRAAAALLLAMGLGWALLDREERRPEVLQAPAVPAVAEAFPAGSLGGEAPCAFLARGSDLVLEAGARVESSGRSLRVESGAVWAEVGVGEPLTIRLPGASLMLRQGAVAVRVPEPRRAVWFFREALAEEAPSAEIWVLEGEAELRVGEAALKIPAGHRWAGGKAEPVAAAEIAALLKRRALAVAAAPGRELASGLRLTAARPSFGADLEAPAAWRWVTVLTGRSPSTEAGLIFGIGGAWRKWVAGLGALPPSAQEVVEVAWDGYWLTARVDGATVFSAGRAQAEALLRPAPEGWRLSVWGGRATVVRSTLQVGS